MNSPRIDLKGKIIYAHKGFFNRASYKTYHENSLEVFKIAGDKGYIQIIELDIRKSKDGVLYCYHGSPFQYLFSLRLSQSFAPLQKKYHVSTVKDVLEVLPREKGIVLDIKDTQVTRADILKVFAGKTFREVVIANKSVSYHAQFNDMPKEFTKMLNGNALSVFYDFKKLRSLGFKYIEIVFPFLATKKTLNKIKESGLEFVGFPAVIFWSENQYLRCLEKYNLPYVPAYFVN